MSSILLLDLYFLLSAVLLIRSSGKIFWLPVEFIALDTPERPNVYVYTVYRKS